MSTEKTEALVIRLVDFSETSRVVTLFTRDFGRVSALAKGGRRLKGPFESALDLLATCRIVFIRKRSDALDLLTEAHLVWRYRPDNLFALYSGYYIAELLEALTEPYDPYPLVYDTAQDVLRRLQDGLDPRRAVLRFELVTLREIGLLPDFQGCAHCGEPLGRGGYVYWISAGGLLCQRCRAYDAARQEIHAGSIAALKRLADPAARQWQTLSLSPQQFHELRYFTTSTISHIIGRRPRTLRYLESLDRKKPGR
ncbi:MAG: DNA repair protein RecO [Planctomycetota bacterium]|nr:MAG: DNA repair protein RecO [Planctomycetota bacterium]